MGSRFWPLLSSSKDNLRQDRPGDVVIGFGVIDHKFLPAFDHLGEIIEGYIGGRGRIIQTAICVFFDRNRLALVRRRFLLPTSGLTSPALALFRFCRPLR